MKQGTRVLSAPEERLLGVVAECIFPATDTPGAAEIGALDYIKTALRDAYTAFVPLYRSGLHALERRAKVKFSAPFTALSCEQKDAVLKEFESGKVPGYKRAAEFFETVRYHVLEGVFCEPQYGGNKDMTGWRLVGFPGQQFGYPDPYIDKRVDLPPIAVDTVWEDD